MKNSKRKGVIFIIVFLILIGLFTVVYSKSFYEYIIGHSFIGKYQSSKENSGDEVDENTIHDDLNEKDIVFDGNEASPEHLETEKTEDSTPTIQIKSVNAEHKDDPNYITYEINITDAYYTQEADGEIIKKEIPNMISGTISLPRPIATSEDTE